MHLKNVLIICSALFSQFTNGVPSNAPKLDGGDTVIPPFPAMCTGKRSPYKDAVWMESAVCVISQPGEVVNYRIQCEGATYVDFSIRDCCIPGDRWQLKGKVWDNYPNTAVTTTPGDPINSPGSVSRVYNYDDTPTPGRLEAFVECSYLHGINAFDAAAYVYFSSDGINCSLIEDSDDTRIDRTP